MLRGTTQVFRTIFYDSQDRVLCFGHKRTTHQNFPGQFYSRYNYDDNLDSLSSSFREPIPSVCAVEIWAGVIFSFTTVPIYLLMNIFEGVRKSDKWEVIADGCNVGFVFLALILHILLTHFLTIQKHACPVFIFVWIFAISVILTYAVRSKPSDRQVWRFGCRAFVIVLLYGPFRPLFKGRFPECAEHKRVRRNIFGCFVYGMVCTITVIATALRNLQNNSTT